MKNRLKGHLLTVTATVADLLAGPSVSAERLTQLLLNEALCCLDEEDDWYMVEALEQPKLTDQGWQGYTGWVRMNRTAFIESLPVLDGVLARGSVASMSSAPVMYLSAGTRVETTGKREEDRAGIRLPGGATAWVPSAHIRRMNAAEGRAEKREMIIETARSFIGTPYLWGGRSTFSQSLAGSASPETGVDCSGLVNLSYRAAGMDVPRDAGDQHAAARPISPDKLKPADLIFLTSGEGHGIDHVLLYLGEELLIEAAETGRPVEVRTFSSRFGCGFGEMMRMAASGGSRPIYCGSFLEGVPDGKGGSGDLW
jgi:cell wall-associated NlpC family hydrolase